MPTLTFNVEIDWEVPATLPTGIQPIRQTYQAHAGLSALCTAWVRGDAGKSDLTGLTLTVDAIPYGRTVAAATWEATSTETGRVDFAVPPTTQRGLYRLVIRAANDAGEVLVQAGLLEVV